MKWFRRIIFGSIFFILTAFILLYTYAFIDRLPLDEQRKNITIYDCNGNVMYESNFKKICSGLRLTIFLNSYKMPLSV